MAERTELRRLPILTTSACGCGCECCSGLDQPETKSRAEGFPLPIPNDGLHLWLRVLRQV